MNEEKKKAVTLEETNELNQEIKSSLSSCDYIKDAMEDILSNCKIKHNPLTDPEDELSPVDLLDYYSKPYGVYHREVTLDSYWYKLAFGPMLGTLKEDNRVIALIPNKIKGYSYFDYKKNKKILLTKRNAKNINPHATYFYRPFPLKSLKIKDLLKFSVSQFRFSDVFFFLLITLFTTLIGLLSPVITNTIFNYVVKMKDLDVLVSIAMFLVFYTIGQLVFSCYKNLFQSNIGIKLNTNVQAAVMQRILSLPAPFFSKYNSGELSQRSSYISGIVTTSIYSIGVAAIESLFSLIYVFQIFFFAPSLVLPSFLLILLNVGYSIVMAFANEKVVKKTIEVSAKEVGMSYSIIEGIQKIKITGSEDRMYKRWAALYAQSAELTFNPPWYIKYSRLFSSIISLGGEMLIYYISIVNHITVAGYYSFTSAYGLAAAGFMALVGVIQAVASIRPSYEMAKPLLDEVPEIDSNKKILTNIHGDIAFNNVSFAYPNSDIKVLNNLSFKIKEGEYVALVGKTGCGKSTIMKIILGFLKPQTGNVTFDSHDLSEVDLPSLRTQIGSVMQECRLFTGDIYNNIVISAPTSTMDQAWEAAKIAKIDKDIEEMPMGMFTYISEGNGGISGGQRQRLAIARAVVNKPKVLIFDEATSALDNVTQKAVSDAIDNLKCTRIVIAHRLSTIEHCDRILLIDKGQVVEEGTYNELIKLNGKFAKLVEKQRIDK